MHHHGEFSGGIVHSTVQVYLLMLHLSLQKVLDSNTFPRSLRVSQVGGANLPHLSTTTPWTWCLPYNVALWKGEILKRRNTDG